MRRTVAVVLTLSALVVATCSACTSDDDDLAETPPDLRACLADADRPEVVDADWTSGQAQESWSGDGALDCAIDTLASGELQRVLRDAFPDLGELSGGELEAQRDAQLDLVASWARRSGEGRSMRAALDRVERLLAATWVADSDEVALARGLTVAAVLGIRSGDDRLVEFDHYASSNPDVDDSGTSLVDWFTFTGEGASSSSLRVDVQEASTELLTALDVPR